MPYRLALPDTTASLDPIARANELFVADTRSEKINLGIGVYTDETGTVPLMRAVREAEQLIFDAAMPHRYLPIAGLRDFNRQMQALALGDDARRAVTVQTLGGTGALALAAAFLKQVHSGAEVLISDPSWENHRAIFEAAGFLVGTYPYYDAVTHAVAFDAMIDRLGRAASGSIVVLHACCHNPTGLDLDDDQWDRVIDVIAAGGLMPVCDMAYQGFGRGLVEDREPIRRLVARSLDVVVATSLSKSLALYGDRVGGLTVVTSSNDETSRAATRLNRIVRSSYSNPPTHGAAIASAVFASTELRRVWEDELTGMRTRIDRMRIRLCAELARLAPSKDLSFIARQRGMFSYTGLSEAEVARLHACDAIHLLATGRLCVAALNDGNVQRAAEAIGRVLCAR